MKRSWSSGSKFSVSTKFHTKCLTGNAPDGSRAGGWELGLEEGLVEVR